MFTLVVWTLINPTSATVPSQRPVVSFINGFSSANTCAVAKALVVSSQVTQPGSSNFMHIAGQCIQIN
jgi:hypothetical protein